MKFRKSKPETDSPSRMDIVASKIAVGIRCVQSYWAESMSKIARKASLKTQWVFFMLFLIGSFCNCCWLIYQSVAKQSPVLSKPAMQLPIMVRPLTPLDTLSDDPALKKGEIHKDSLTNKP